jgi:hypothetical protein
LKTMLLYSGERKPGSGRLMYQSTCFSASRMTPNLPLFMQEAHLAAIVEAELPQTR